MAVKDPFLAKRIYAVQNGFGAILGPQDCWLLLRGIKTLKVRMDYQQKNAEKLAQWLAEQEEVSQVYYPGTGKPRRKRYPILDRRTDGGRVSFF